MAVSHLLFPAQTYLWRKNSNTLAWTNLIMKQIGEATSWLSIFFLLRGENRHWEIQRGTMDSVLKNIYYLYIDTGNDLMWLQYLKDVGHPVGSAASASVRRNPFSRIIALAHVTPSLVVNTICVYRVRAVVTLARTILDTLIISPLGGILARETFTLSFNNGRTCWGDERHGFRLWVDQHTDLWRKR